MSSTFDRLQARAKRIGYTLLKENGEHDGVRYRYVVHLHADLEYDDDNYDSGGLFTGKSFCSSLREVKDAIQGIREDELSLRFHGTMTFDFGETEPRNVHFQCTVRGSCHSLSMVSAIYGRREREAEERFRKWREENERRRRRREERAREREKKEQKENGDRV